MDNKTMFANFKSIALYYLLPTKRTLKALSTQILTLTMSHTLESKMIINKNNKPLTKDKEATEMKTIR